MSHAKRRLRASHWLLLGAMVVLYNDWLFGSLLEPRLSTVRSLISELSASSQPRHWAFQSMDIAAGLLSLAVVPAVWRFVRTRDKRYPWVLPLTFTLIGLDSIIDATLPISCAPSVNRACDLATTSSLITDAHMIESTLIGAVIFAAPLLWWRWHRRSHTIVAQASLWFAIVQSAVAVAILGTRAAHVDAVGIFQRLYEFGAGLWMATITGAALPKQRKTLRRQEPVANVGVKELAEEPVPAS